jgi:hypothetical protein
MVARACERGLIPDKPESTIDATGLETRHVSRHYVRRTRADRSSTHAAWPKLTAVAHTHTHIILGAMPGRGPSQDSPDFGPALRQASANLHLDCLLADTGYDGEHNHRLAREELGIRLTAIKLNPRNAGGQEPKGRYRAQLHRRFPKRRYHRRAHAECVFSRLKRHLGSALTARNDESQAREMLLRVLTHNLMLLLLSLAESGRKHTPNTNSQRCVLQ